MKNKDKTNEQFSELMEILQYNVESENFYQTAFKNAGIATVIFKKDNTILLVNGEFEKLTGYAREEVEGKKKWMEFVHQKDDLERMKEYHRLRLIDPLSAPRTYEFQLVNRNGQVKDIVATVAKIPRTKQTLMTLLDITDRKRMETALRESERRLADTIDFLPDATFAIDLSGKVIAWNRAIEEMTGIKAEDMLGKGNYEYTMAFYGIRRPMLVDLAFGFIEDIVEKYDFVKREGNVFLAETDVTVRGIPHTLWGKAGPLYDGNGNVAGAIESIRDITDHKRSETALAESERRLADIIDFLPDATFAIDLSGKVIAWNRAIEEMTGVKAEDMLGKGDHEYIIPFYGIRRPVLIDLVFESNEELEKKYDFVKRKGDILLAEADVPVRGIPHTLWGKAGPLYDCHGNIVGAIESVRDITEHKNAEKALQKAHDELEIRVQERTAELVKTNDALQKEIFERKRAEEVVKDSEKKFAATFYKSPIPMAITAVKDGRYVDVNESFLKVMGLKYEELVGNSSTGAGYITSESRALFLEEFRQKGFVENLELPMRVKDGKWRRGLFNSTKITIGSEDFFLTMVTDITERKQAEEKLRQSEEMLNSVFKAAPISLCILKNRTYQSVNKAWCEKFGYSETDLIGRTTRFLYESEEEYERVGWELYASLPAKGLASVVTRIRRKDDAFRDVIVTAVPLQRKDISLGEVVAIEDITDRKFAEKELRKSRRQLANIIEFLPDATLVIDKDGKVIAWNRAIEKMTGIKKEDMLGKGNHEYALPFCGYRRNILVDLALHPDREMERNYKSIQRVGDVLLGDAYAPNLPSGNIHVSATASVLRDSSGEVIAAIECIRDNTEHKKLEEQLSRAQKMEALGTLAGGVAHDLNNVLGVLVGYTELMKQDLPKNSISAEYAENILQSGVRATAIIQDLLTMARRGVTVSKIVDLNKLVVDYLKTPEFENLQTSYPNVRITTELEDGLLNIKGSPIHLTKTIMNLVSNAVESISGEGKISIRTKNLYLDQPIHGYDTIQEGDYTVLIVSDSGSGISAKDIDKIFEPFYTKKVMGRSGTGLGLAVVWGTVKDHKGYIDVKSEEGKGSTFTLYFPVTREALAKAEKKVSYLAYTGKGESILVVDDVKEQREMAVSILEKLGYQIEAVASGEEAIEYLKNKKADLIVLDMIMPPGIDGFETYRRILDINARQKAVIVSGFSETDRVRKMQEMGAGKFVRKPYTMEKIGLAVRNELDREQA